MPTADAHQVQKNLLAPRHPQAEIRGVKWTRCGENLVRHPAGTIYLRAKVGGKKVRQSLDTSDLRQAKRKRDDLLETLRHAAGLGDRNIETIGEALALEKELTLGKPKIKPATRDYYEHIFGKIEASLPGHKHAATWTPDEARKWWSAHCKDNPSPQHANNALAIVRRAMLTVVERGIRRDDPTKSLKRLKIPQTRIDDMPSPEQMADLVASIRGQGLRCSEEAADMVEFLMWSGMRISELRALRWEHVDASWITVTGGEKGTKNHEIRQIPVNPRLAAILARRRWPDAVGPVFHIRTPRLALAGACRRLGLRHMRVHDLRHWFTTHCSARGIDVVTLAAWLGHKDGGKTLLKTYAHHQKLHSLASAQKLG